MRTRKRRYYGTVSAGSLLDDVINRKNWEHQLALHQVFLFWQKAVGEGIAQRAIPHVIRKGTLWVKVVDSVWMHHLHLQKPLLLEKLNSRLHNVSLDDIRFQLDHRLVPGAVPDKKKKYPIILRPAPPLPEFLKNDIKSLEDTDLQEAIIRAWEKAHS